MVRELTFIAVCNDFFGKLPGQTFLEFRNEIKKLSTKDREDIKTGLKQNGYKIIEAGING